MSSKILLIDFGLSVKFNESERSPQVLPLQVNDRTAPEFQRPGFKKVLYNPFPTDIYYLGNLVRTVVDVSPIYDDQAISEALSTFRQGCTGPGIPDVNPVS